MWLDTCDPWSYLGLRHLRAAIASCDHGDNIEVYLHAYLLDPDLEVAAETPRIVALVESGAASLDEIREADERMCALGAREGIRFNFDSFIIAPTSRAHRVIAAAHVHRSRAPQSGPAGLVMTGYSTMSHVIPVRVFQTLKSRRWNCNVLREFRKLTDVNYVRLLLGLHRSSSYR